MNYKYLALDLDGTLTLPDKTVSEKCKKYIKKAQKKGICIYYHTSRH